MGKTPTSAADAAVRVGIYGGTFDPPHVGHLITAQDAVEALDLDELRFMVAGRPPHKPDQPLTRGEVRVAMMEAAVGDDERFRVSRRELERDGPSYTVDTLRALVEDEPDVRRFLLMGADQFAELDGWKEPREIARMATLAVMAREGSDPGECDPRTEVRYERVPVTRVDVSSTMVRERVRAGRPVRYLVPEAVRRIIEERRLYLRDEP